MKIAIFGLGYVGSVTAACLAKMGHTVLGVDISPVKVQMINEGCSPVMEKGLDALVKRAVWENRLRATWDDREALKRADVSLIAVGTPSCKDGSVNLDYVKAAAESIGRGLRTSKRYHTVALRSTVPPGTTAKVLIPVLNRASGKKAGRDFGVCFHPEFLREGSSVDDFFHPARTVIGRREARSSRMLVKLWQDIRAPLFETPLEVAEMIKYADNAFHALKICFANEVGTLCKSQGIDGQEVMDIFVRDKKLNISPSYLKPGFAFGGPCLPKDVRSLCAMAHAKGLKAPLLENILPSNASHLRRAVEMVLATGKKNIGVLGLVFKSDTDDLRESPACELVRELLRAKKTVRIYDPKIDLGRLLGANRAFVESELPSLPRLLADSMEDVVRASEVVVLACNHPEFQRGAAKLKRGRAVLDVVDLVGVPGRQ